MAADIGSRDRARRFRLIPIAEAVRDIRPPDWLARGYIERNSLALFFGEPETAKSFCAIDVGLSVACGVDWQGAKVKAGAVIYVAGEGRQGIARRVKAWAIRNGIELEGIPFGISNMATELTSARALAELDDAVDSFADVHGWPALIVIDTLSRNFGSGDENSTQDMSVVIAACDALRERTGATVLLVHHSGHGDKGRSRGSGALRAGVDAEYMLTRCGDLITFKATKMKDGPRPDPLTFELRIVDLGMDDEEGAAVTSAVLMRVNPAIPAKQSRGELIASMNAGGLSVREIAERLNVGKSTVQRELDRLRGCPTVPPYRVVGQRDTNRMESVPLVPGQCGTGGTDADAYRAAKDGAS